MLSKKTTLLLLKILGKITSDKILHSKWLNTLSYLEYIGTRKILKTLPADILDAYFLEHINEEARHSLFFKKLAQKQISKKRICFTKNEMLASQSASNYFQHLDHYSSRFCLSNPVLNYFYTSYIIEHRALIVYALYNDILRQKMFSFSLQPILKDEENHLNFVFQKIKNMDILWESHLEELKLFEHKKYFSFLIDLEKEVFEFPFLSSLTSLNKEEVCTIPQNRI